MKSHAGIVRRVVVVDDLPEQLHFAVAAGGRLAHLGQDVGLRAHPLVAARVRHDAEAAELVAALDDRHVRLDRIAAPRHAERKRHIVVRIEVDVHAGPACARSACSTSIGRRRIACVPTMTSATPGERLQDRLAFLLRDAAGDRDDRIVALLRRQLTQLAEPRVELLLGALADAAGVDDDDVGVRRVVGRFVAGLFEQAGHPLRVVDVHLAAERLDQVFPRQFAV